MNYYETLYIIHPALDAGRVKEMVISVNEILEKTGGNVASIDVWGKKKLAYEIDKQKYGTYILIQFKGDGSGNAKFNVELEHNPNILAYLTLRIEENKVLDQTLSLDEQIRGDNPSASPSKPDRKTRNVKEEVDKDGEDKSNEDENSESSLAEKESDIQEDDKKTDDELEKPELSNDDNTNAEGPSDDIADNNEEKVEE